MSGKQRKLSKKSRSSGVTRQELNGMKMHVPENPPEVTFQPWNHLTVVDNFSDRLDITVHDLTRQTWGQLDPNQHSFKECPEDHTRNEFRLLIKVLSVRAWALAGKMIALSVEDFLVPNKDKAAVDQLCGIVDTGNANHTPAVGYKLPMAHQNAVHRDAKDNFGAQHLFRIQCDGPGMCYTNILWRCDGPSNLPTFDRCVEQMVKDIRFMTRNSNQKINSLDKRVEKINTQIDDLISKQPSLVNEVLNEIPIGAAAVTAFASESLVNLFSELKVLRNDLASCSSFENVTDYE